MAMIHEKAQGIKENQTYYNPADAINALMADMAEEGLPCDRSIDPHKSCIQRYSADEKRDEPDEWCRVWNHGDFFVASYGSWSTGEKFVFRYPEKDNDNHDPAIERKRREIIEECKRKCEAEIEELHKKARIDAKNIWNNAKDKPLSAAHTEYFQKKGVDYRLLKGIKYNMYKNIPQTIVPLRDINGILQSLQFIFKNKNGKHEKRFLPGGQKNGSFHVINDEPINDGDTLYVGEGYVTCVSVYHSVKAKNVHVIFSVDAGNLDPVVVNLCKQYPNCKIIIAGDADERGRKAAILLLQKYGCPAVFPDIPQDQLSDEYKDFNDVEQRHGAKKVMEDIAKQLMSEPAKPNIQELAIQLSKIEEPCEGFSLDGMPGILKDHVLELCSTTSAHPLAVLGSLLTTASAAVGKRYFMEQKNNGGEFFSRLYLNIWMIFIAPSGQYKSTALAAGARYTVEHRIALHEAEKSKLADIAVEKDENNKTILEKELYELRNSNIMFPEKMTPEALRQFLGRGRAGAAFYDEMGGFIKELAKPNNIGLMQDYTKYYDVPALIEDATKTQGSNFIERPYISFYGITNLPWFSSSLQNEDVRGGFYARFLLTLLPKPKERAPAWPHERYTAKAETYKAFKATLDSLPKGERIYKSSKKTHDRHEEVYNWICDMADQFNMEEQAILEPYVKRWPVTILKISMLMQIFIDPEADIISIEAYEAAVAFVLPAIKSTIHLFRRSGGLGATKIEQTRNQLYATIVGATKELGRAPNLRELYKNSRLIASLSTKDRDDAMEFLEAAGYIKRLGGGSQLATTVEILQTDEEK